MGDDIKAEALALQQAKFAARSVPHYNIKSPISMPPVRLEWRWLAYLVGILFLVVGPSLGVITQLSTYLDKTIIFWSIGIMALILWLRRRPGL